MKTLFVLNESPYVGDRSKNALQLSLAILESQPDAEISVSLLSEAVVVARRVQKLPDSPSSADYALKCLVERGAQILLCDKSMYERDISIEDVNSGVRRSNLGELASISLSADRLVVF